METVHDTDVVFETIGQSGLRATIGKCMMDSAVDAPPRLREDTRSSIDESVAIRKRWDGAANGRLHAAFAPRFAVSVTATMQAVGIIGSKRCGCFWDASGGHTWSHRS